MRLRRSAAALAGTILLAACSGSVEPTPGEQPEQPVDGFPGDTWATADPADAGFQPDAFAAIDNRQQRASTSCYVVVRDGQVVHEKYFKGAKATSPGPVFSITKSFTSVLVGIAADEGKLDLDDKASDYIPQWRGTESADVTIRDLLSNTSGRHWSFSADYQHMALSEQDKTKYAIALGQDAKPGTVWTYNNSAIQTLEAVLTKATGQQPNDYAQKRIFEPLGMDDTEWLEDASGNAMTFAGVQSTCLDLARFGLLMQYEGEWKGQQIVSSDYVEEATSKPSSDLNAGYGLLWWVNREGPILGASAAMGGPVETNGRVAPRAPDDAFWALGAGKQILSVVPGKKLVAVRIGTAPSDPLSLSPDTFTGDIMDALR